MVPPTTISGQAALKELTSLSRELKYYADGFKATKNLRGKLGELETLKQRVSTATQSTKDLEKQFKSTKQVVDKVKQTADKAGKVTDALKKGNWGDVGSKFAKALSLGLLAVNIFSLILGFANKWAIEQITDVMIRNSERAAEEFTAQIRVLNKQNARIASLEKLTKQRLDNEDKIYAESASAAKNATKARELANNALYETRQGRKILESQVSVAKKNANDALYETRAGRQKLEAQITAIQTKINQSLSSIGQGFQQQVNSTIANIQKSLQQTQTEARKASTQVETQSRLISNLQTTLNQFKATAVNSTQIVDTAVVKVKDFFNPQIRELKNDISTIKVTFNKDIQQTNQNVIQLGVTVKSYTGVADTLQATYSQSFEAKANQFYQEQLKTQSNFLKEVKTTTTTTTTTLDKTKKEIDALKAENGQIKTDLQDLEKQIKQQEKVNNAALPKLDSILAAIPLIPAKVADKITPNIPTPQDIEKATGTAMCKSLNGGCSGKALNDAVGNINNNANNNTNNVLNALGAASDVTNLALLPIINNKLGDQLPGGLSRIAGQITRNQAISQIVNLVTMIAAIHNAVQLSNNVGSTLFSLLDNLFAIPSLIINPEGSTIDTHEVFTGAIENVMKGIFGVQEWEQIKAKWQSFNRIYQAAANSVNEIRSIGSSLNDAISTTATLTGRGFNALQNDGILSDDNWEPTPENLRLKGGIYAKLGKLADGITIVGETLEAIESVTSEIRSAVESANQIKTNTSEMEAEVKKLLGEETVKRDEAIEALPPKEFSWEDLI